MAGMNRRELIAHYDDTVARASGKHKRLESDILPFKATAIDEFKSVYQIGILLNEQPSYFAHKEVLFQILCMDVLAPDRRKYRKAAAAITMVDCMIDAQQATYNHIEHAALAEQLANFHTAGPVFFDQIYHPLGGIKAIRDAPARRGWGSSVLKLAQDVEDVIHLMTVYHYHYEHLRHDPGFNRASLNLGSKLVPTVRKGRETKLSKRTVQERWAGLKDSAAMLYAASSIEHDDRTLLRCIIEDWLTFEDVEPVFSEWVARARFVASEILMNCAERDTASDNLEKLPEVAPMPFSAPVVPPERAREIADAFRRKPRA